jgi:hypothetical protein
VIGGQREGGGRHSGGGGSQNAKNISDIGFRLGTAAKVALGLALVGILLVACRLERRVTENCGEHGARRRVAERPLRA